MKDSFKTFPSKHGLTPAEWCIKAEEWKERIENQLREELENKEMVKSQPIRASSFSVKKYWIEKILG